MGFTGFYWIWLFFIGFYWVQQHQQRLGSLKKKKQTIGLSDSAKTFNSFFFDVSGHGVAGAGVGSTKRFFFFGTSRPNGVNGNGRLGLTRQHLQADVATFVIRETQLDHLETFNFAAPEQQNDFDFGTHFRPRKHTHTHTHTDTLTRPQRHTESLHLQTSVCRLGSDPSEADA